MKTPLIALTAICMFGLGSTIQAQNAIPASGANAAGSGGSVSYTVGQVVYTTSTGTNGSVAQGVQHPYEISVVTGIEEALGISLEVSVHPNPAQDFIILKIKNYEVVNLRYQLYDINGSLLLSNKVEGQEMNISMQNILPSVYFLKVADNNKVIKTFKIIKN
jgi:hypothetical protein